MVVREKDNLRPKEYQDEEGTRSHMGPDRAKQKKDYPVPCVYSIAEENIGGVRLCPTRGLYYRYEKDFYGTAFLLRTSFKNSKNN